MKSKQNRVSFSKKLALLVEGDSKQTSDNKCYEEAGVTVCVSMCVILEWSGKVIVMKS